METISSQEWKVPKRFWRRRLAFEFFLFFHLHGFLKSLGRLMQQRSPIWPPSTRWDVQQWNTPWSSWNICHLKTLICFCLYFFVSTFPTSILFDHCFIFGAWFFLRENLPQAFHCQNLRTKKTLLSVHYILFLCTYIYIYIFKDRYT